MIPSVKTVCFPKQYELIHPFFLTFRGPCIVIFIFRYISNKMQRYTVYLFMGKCSKCFGWYLHPSSGAHTTVSTASCTCQTVLLNICGSVHHAFVVKIITTRCNIVKPLLLPAAIVEELELCSNSSTIAAGSSYGLTSTRYCKYSCVCSWWWVEIQPETCKAVFQK